VDGLLDLLVEVLNAEADPVESSLGEHLHLRLVDMARVDLAADLGVGSYVREMRPDGLDDLLQLLGAHEGRCPPAEMQLDHFS